MARPLAAWVGNHGPNPAKALALLALAAAAFLSGCKPVGPNYHKPDFAAPDTYKESGAPSVTPPPAPVNGAWKPANPSDGMLRGKWWEVYNDPQLNKFEERIATDNQALKQATESYLAARDQVAVTRADLFPRFSLNPSATHVKNSIHRANISGLADSEYNDLILGGQGGWEPDFWGRIRRSVESARASAQANAAELASVDLSLQSELAADYFALRGLDSQIALLRRIVADLEHQLELTQKRLQGGVATDVDVAQAQTQLETVRAQLVDVSAARAVFEHAVGTIGAYDLSRFSIPFSPLDMPLPQIPVGVPSQLLERRPDIATQERLTAAANARIGVAIAAFYPTINLGGAGGFESTHGGTWLQGPSAFWSLGAQATQILFDAGQRHALTDQARHQYEAQAAAYRNTIFQAFQDVEDNLSTLRILNEETTVQQRAVASAQHSLDLSNQRYKAGATSYLEVITAETALIANERTLTDLQTRQFAASVQLTRALGGGWDISQLPR
jgi:NodT family efflux transporter outer membrane factor (OMF) lipoprotein